MRAVDIWAKGSQEAMPPSTGCAVPLVEPWSSKCQRGNVVGACCIRWVLLIGTSASELMSSANLIHNEGTIEWVGWIPNRFHYLMSIIGLEVIYLDDLIVIVKSPLSNLGSVGCNTSGKVCGNVVDGSKGKSSLPQEAVEINSGDSHGDSLVGEIVGSQPIKIFSNIKWGC